MGASGANPALLDWSANTHNSKISFFLHYADSAQLGIMLFKN